MDEMKIIVSSFYYPNYKDLADKTIYQNLKHYCEKNGYEFLPFALESMPEGTPYEIACQACRLNTQLILKTLEDRQDFDWFFHRDCDSIITDMDFKLDSIIALYPNAEIITGSDIAGISMGQVLVKNTYRVKKYLAMVLAGIDSGSYEHEQKFMWANPVEFLKETPQRMMNSYDCEARLENDVAPSSWQEGDFLVHMAGLNLEQKMSRLDYWMGKVR